jgi:hypothetical protein
MVDAVERAFTVSGLYCNQLRDTVIVCLVESLSQNKQTIAQSTSAGRPRNRVVLPFSWLLLLRHGDSDKLLTTALQHGSCLKSLQEMKGYVDHTTWPHNRLGRQGLKPCLLSVSVCAFLIDHRCASCRRPEAISTVPASAESSTGCCLCCVVVPHVASCVEGKP